MPNCRKCSAPFPSRLKIAGKWKVLNHRKYCLTCSPWGQHNTKILDGTPDRRVKRDANIKLVVAYRRRIKLKAIAYKGGACETCGYTRSVRGLCFHHKDPTQKDFNISARAMKWETAVVELDKCLLLCLNCHAELHEELDGGNVIEIP